MVTSISDQIAYRDACLRAATDDAAFVTFRRHSALTPIWENLTVELAQMFLSRLGPFNWDSIVNDQFGSPFVYDFAVIQRRVSPTTVRHVYTYQQLVRYFDLDSINYIAEIGGGYGGLAAVLLSQKQISYRIYDLPETLALANKFVGACGYSLAQFQPKSADLVISNYAFSELTRETQEFYFANVIATAKAVYMVYNHISHIFGVDSWDVEYLADRLKQIGFTVEIRPEYPLTYTDNKVLIAKR
jgi:hypothetical protein